MRLLRSLEYRIQNAINTGIERQHPSQTAELFGLVASIVTVLDLSAKVLGCINAVKDAGNDRARCGLELANMHGLLVSSPTTRKRRFEGMAQDSKGFGEAGWSSRSIQASFTAFRAWLGKGRKVQMEISEGGNSGHLGPSRKIEELLDCLAPDGSFVSSLMLRGHMELTEQVNFRRLSKTIRSTFLTYGQSSRIQTAKPSSTGFRRPIILPNMSPYFNFGKVVQRSGLLQHLKSKAGLLRPRQRFFAAAILGLANPC